jgi:hypothetical protein
MVPIRLVPKAEYWPQFTDREVELIAAALPDDVVPRRLELLPLILREWARVYLPHHFSGESAATRRQRRTRLAKVGKIVASLLRATEDLDETDLWDLAAQIGIAEGQSFLQAAGNEQNRLRLGQGRDFIATIAVAAGKPLWGPSRGQPRNIPAYLVTQDLAALYEYLTRKEATRIVNRTSHAECGPFYDFAAATWPVLFGQGDDGLAAAIRNWSPWRHREKSPVIVNIGLRHPEWGVFER